MHTVNNLGITTITMNHEIVDDVATKFQLLSGDIKQGVLIWKVMRSSQGEKYFIFIISLLFKLAII